MMARDIAFATAQGFYHFFAKIETAEGGYKIDLSEATELTGKRPPLYISLKNGIEPKGAIGASVSLYETKKAFKTYEIIPSNDSILLQI